MDLCKYLCHWIVVAWSKGASGHVVDYGRHEVASDSLGVEQALMVALRELKEVFAGRVMLEHRRTLRRSSHVYAAAHLGGLEVFGATRRADAVRDTESIEYFGDSGPTHTANCLPNEVDVPNVVGEPVTRAKTVLAGQPLAATVVYRPAQPRQRVGVVVRQFPAGGRHLSSGDRVTIVLSKALEGVVPNVVGMTIDRAKVRLKSLKLDVTSLTDAPCGGPGRRRCIRPDRRTGQQCGQFLRGLF